LAAAVAAAGVTSATRAREGAAGVADFLRDLRDDDAISIFYFSKKTFVNSLRCTCDGRNTSDRLRCLSWHVWPFTFWWLETP
jgi:hypothetical protein